MTPLFVETCRGVATVNRDDANAFHFRLGNGFPDGRLSRSNRTINLAPGFAQGRVSLDPHLPQSDTRIGLGLYGQANENQEYHEPETHQPPLGFSSSVFFGEMMLRKASIACSIATP